MVQRKVPNKLGIQADHLRNHDQKLLISLKKPSSSQHQDGKKRGPDLKKKMMKKSKSFKLSDIDHQSLKSSPSSALILRKNNISQPGKPPPPPLNVPPSTPPTVLLPQHKRHPPIDKTADGSPNYMKSTSCFEARKEQQSQVSLRNSHSRFEWRSSSSSKLVSSASNNKKLAKTSNKTLSSSKLFRTLTKTPSFKHSRSASAKKKSSRVAFCTTDHVNVQRATCSSTLKDSKFPSYLTLNPGGTESEGTSIMKVCPYTYCSLNGHLHAPVPPLKCFLSARRRSLKTQKNIKIQDLSPRKTKTVPSEEEMKGGDSLQVKFDNEEAAEEVGMDFFIEIYSKTKESDEKKTNFLSSKGEDEVKGVEVYIEEQVVESLSNSSPQSEIDTEESLGMAENFSEEEGKDYADRDYSPFLNEEETEGSFPSESASETTDMELEEGKFSDAKVEDGADNSSEMDDESESVFWCSSEILSNCNVDTIQDYESEACKEDSVRSEGELVEENATQQVIKIQESGEVSESSIYDQLSRAEDEFYNLSSNEENLGEDDKIDSMYIFMAVTSSMEEPSEEMKDKVAEAENMINPTEVTEEDTCSDDQDESNDDDETNGETKESSETGKQIDYARDILEEIDQATDAAKASEEYPSVDSGPERHEVVVPKVEESINSGNTEQDIDHNQNTLLKICHGNEDQNEINQEKLPETEEDSKSETETMKVENKTEKQSKRPSTFSRLEQSNDDQEELLNRWNRSRRGVKDVEDETTREFNPRPPNYLPLVAEPEGEKVDLRHQMMDERKNSEEWMIDYALQRAVTKLAPAKKRKVALLVEAFETVTPITHHHHHLHHPHAIRPIQACS
ncbi:Calmodulin-binding domain [Parasponia andersonii]|uniref:Calmodulin-binding domain n=1 Tax=Parasponia andersonii TaxID=3476 RepID=A0A2P5E083_PARAD|nr:Calmodulin-binding domain [Parasponia andersonii]